MHVTHALIMWRADDNHPLIMLHENDTCTCRAASTLMSALVKFVKLKSQWERKRLVLMCRILIAFRSSKQCKLRYETVIVPREEGRILYDMNPRKQKKTKGIYKVYAVCIVSLSLLARYILLIPRLPLIWLTDVACCENIDVGWILLWLLVAKWWPALNKKFISCVAKFVSLECQSERRLPLIWCSK